MRIVIDKNIPLPDPLFGNGVEIVRAVGVDITSDLLRNAEALLVRSVTKVNENLLHGTAVRFVGTATIGEDHIDTAYLRSRRIGFASAPGSNANSVAEYVAAALLVLAHRFNLRLDRLTIGVVGVGNVGRRVVNMATGLGMRVLKNDPPLARSTGDKSYLHLDQLMEADVISLHVPLTKAGADATWHFFDERRIGRMKRGSILINTSRGAVVATDAMKEALRSQKLQAAVVDVWENEPMIDVEALSLTSIGTAHIAGYSADGKINGARIMYEALCANLGLPNRWESAAPRLPDPEIPRISIDAPQADLQSILREVVTKCYPIERDDAGLRGLLTHPADRRPQGFADLRSKYPARREFSAVTVSVPEQEHRLQQALASLGFHTVTQ